MKEIDLMAGNLFKDALPNDFFSYEMGIHLDEGFIAFMKVWMKLFPTPDILAFVGLSGFKEKTEGELTENNLLYRVRKINRVERYAVYLRSLDDLLRALKAAIFEINNGFKGYIFIERMGAMPNFFTGDDIARLIPDYKHTIFLFEEGISFISKDKRFSTIEKVKKGLLGYYKINID